MKKSKIITLFLFLFGFSTLVAQQANEILGIAKEVKSAAYYKQQSALWQKETEKKPKNTHAWHQYYKAERAFLQKTYPQKWLNETHEIFDKLNPIIAQSKKQAGASYEYYLMQAANTKEKKSIDYLKEAYQKNPERDETYEGLLVHFIITFQHEKAVDISQKMLQQNYYSNANLKWNYNALQTANPNSIFITNGDMDSMPKWVLQYGKGLKNNVLVINKWLLSYEEEYRKKIFEQMGLSELDADKSTYDKPSQYVDNLVAHIMKNSSQTVYMSCGTDVHFFEEFGLQDDIYLVGTAFLYSTHRVDNLALTKKNVEQNYHLEYLFHDFQSHAEEELIKKYMNITYIPSLMKLKKHYEETNESEKVKYYSTLIEKIAEESGRKKEIMSWY